jgi:hypothetical protein
VGAVDRRHQGGDGVGVLEVDDVGPPLAHRGDEVAGLLIVSGRPSTEGPEAWLLRPVAWTTAPARASSTAMARPAPRVAPATRATRPPSGLSMSLNAAPDRAAA